MILTPGFSPQGASAMCSFLSEIPARPPARGYTILPERALTLDQSLEARIEQTCVLQFIPGFKTGSTVPRVRARRFESTGSRLERSARIPLRPCVNLLACFNIDTRVCQPLLTVWMCPTFGSITSPETMRPGAGGWRSSAAPSVERVHTRDQISADFIAVGARVGRAASALPLPFRHPRFNVLSLPVVLLAQHNRPQIRILSGLRGVVP